MRALVATDGSDASLEAARQAPAVLDADVTYLLVTVVPPPIDPNEGTGGFGGPVVTGQEAADAHRSDVVAADGALAATARAFGPVPLEQHVIEGSPGEAICAFARERDVDVIVVGAQGKGLVARAVLGSVSTHVVGHAPCPVLVVHPAS
jgi:nucleotide-binding universal stress UspA family protein